MISQADGQFPPTDWRRIHEVSLGAAPELRPLLTRTELPLDLSGRSVLHVGCGSGELVAEAARRGAAQVVGLDRDPDAIRVARARRLGANADFIRGDLHMAPQGPFDLILWIDSLVHEPDPRGALGTLRHRLAPGGLLILACQVHIAPGKQMMYAADADGDVYPTMSMLRDMLSGYAVRVIHPIEPSKGGPIEPWTFWCHARRPTVLLIRAHGNTGKSSLAQLLSPLANQVVELDSTVLGLRPRERPGSHLAKFAAEHAHPRMLDTFFDGIDEAGLTEAYVDALLNAISPCDGLTIVEGYMTDRQADLLKHRLVVRGDFVWDAEGVNADAARAAALEQAAAEQTARAAALEQAAAEQTARAAALEQAAAEQTARAAALEQAVAEQTARAAALEQAVAEQTTFSSSLLASKSWRMTSPARRVARLVRNGNSNEDGRS